MATGTDFLPFAGSLAAEVESQIDYAGSAHQLNGFSNGIALPSQANKVWRQSGIMAAAMANYVADVLQDFVPDDGDLNTLLAQLWQAFMAGGYFVDSGSANRISVAAPAGLTFGAPFPGLHVTVKIAATNTTTDVRFNWMGHGDLPVVYLTGGAPAPGDFPAGTYLDFVCDDSGHWRCLSRTLQALKQASFGTEIDILGNVVSAPSGNYTVPAGCYLIQPVLIGGGGGSTASSPITNGAIAGGGGAGVCVGPVINVVPGQSISYAVGPGGTAVVYGATGGNGGTTSFYGGALTATGGTGGSYTGVGAGGVGSGGLLSLQGSPGSPFASSAVGASGGVGGASPYLGSGGGSTGTGIAAAGGWPGGGAGGPGSGGAGSPGQPGANGAIFIYR